MPTQDEAQASQPEPTPARKPTVAELAAQLADVEGLAVAAQEQINALSETTTGLRQDVTDLTQAVREKLADPSPMSLAMEEDDLSDRVGDLVVTKVAEIAGKWQAFADGTEKTLNALASDRNSLDNQVAQLHERLDKLPRVVTGGVETILGDPVPGVFGKVLELMRTVGAIGKDSEYKDRSGSTQFRFRGIEQVMNQVHKAMTSVGLVMFPTILDKTYSSNVAKNSYGTEVLWTTCSLTVRYTFVDPDDGSTQCFEMVGEGRDNADKASSKAASMALKYGLLQALMIPTEDLEDSDRESPQVVQERPQGQAQLPVSQEQAAPVQASKERAARALQGLRALDRFPANQRLDKLAEMETWIQKADVAGFEIEGATLRAHVAAIRGTLTAQWNATDAAHARNEEGEAAVRYLRDEGLTAPWDGNGY